MHPGVFDRFKETADRLEIPYQVEVMPHHSGTDTYACRLWLRHSDCHDRPAAALHAHTG
jgi:putative aminopeptidase FrvX